MAPARKSRPRAGKQGTRPRQRAARAPRLPPLPDPGGDAPLHELSRDQLSVFLYLALLPAETAALVKERGLSQPGFRREGLSEVQRCDLVADEVRAVPEVEQAVLDLLRKAFGGLPLAGWHLDPPGAGELLGVVDHEAALPLVLWRVLADRREAVRSAAWPLLDHLAQRIYGAPPGPAPAGRAEEPVEAPTEARAQHLAGELAVAQRKLEEAERRAEESRLRAAEGRDKLQAQLKEARAREASAQEEAARARSAAEAARAEQARAEAALAAVRREDSFAEAQRARALARDLEGRVGSLESRLERARAREADLERDLAALRTAGGPAAPAGAPPASADEGEGEEAQALWLFPVYTREFYDSLDGWDRRIQRAAFKQAHLLAQDHRHPSLRALPLEGLPGYYRVRVATDVRLLYRRGERQNAVEILSLIDREDLDRYVRQAKTR